MTEENIKIAFDLFDIDKNGTIEIHEFKEVIPTSSKQIVEHSQNHKPHL